MNAFTYCRSPPPHQSHRDTLVPRRIANVPGHTGHLSRQTLRGHMSSWLLRQRGTDKERIGSVSTVRSSQSAVGLNLCRETGHIIWIPAVIPLIRGDQAHHLSHYFYAALSDALSLLIPFPNYVRFPWHLFIALIPPPLLLCPKVEPLLLEFHLRVLKWMLIAEQCKLTKVKPFTS